MTALDDSTEVVTTAAVVDTEISHKPVIEISDVWKLHKLGDEVVKALVAAELQVMPGEFVCLMGPSGSGKSTLLNIIGGLDRPTKGAVKIAGRDTAQLSESQFAALRHDTIGFIFQSYNLIPFLSAVENVELPLMFEPYDRRSLRRRATELLELVGLSHRVHHQPTKMSGGEQQRTAIARSLISSPTLVLADEPTANLDHRTGGRRWCACCATCVRRWASPWSPAPMIPRWPTKRAVSSG